MHYIQILQDSLRLFRTTKLIWVFGFLSLLISLVPPKLGSGELILNCLYFIVFLSIFFVCYLAHGSLIYVIHEAFLNKTSTFADGWHQGKLKILRNIGLGLILGIPILLSSLLLVNAISATMPGSPFIWFFVLTNEVLASSILVFGLCAIMIDDVKTWAAVGTSFLITFNNFFHVFVVIGLIFIIRTLLTYLMLAVLASGLFKVELPLPLTLDYTSYIELLKIPIVMIARWVFDLFFFPLTSIILTLGYLEFTKKITYPALANRSNIA